MPERDIDRITTYLRGGSNRAVCIDSVYGPKQITAATLGLARMQHAHNGIYLNNEYVTNGHIYYGKSTYD